MSHDEEHIMSTSEKLVIMANQIAAFFHSKPREEGISRRNAQTLGHFTQQCVADLMSEYIVDFLEPVEVKAQDGKLRFRVAGLPQYRRQALGECRAIWQAG